MKAVLCVSFGVETFRHSTTLSVCLSVSLSLSLSLSALGHCFIY